MLNIQFLLHVDGTSAFDGTLLFHPGQPVQLEDGSTAYISASNLEDGVSLKQLNHPWVIVKYGNSLNTLICFLFSAGNLQQIELENGATLVALNHIDSDTEIADQSWLVSWSSRCFGKFTISL